MNRFTSLLLLVIYSSIAGAWTFDETFEEQSVGTRASSTSAQWFSKTIVTDTVVPPGKSIAVELGITGGKNGWGEFGGIYTFPQALKAGDKVWFRVRQFFPESFDYRSSTFALKFMRIHTRNATTLANEGYLDIYVRPDGTLLFQSELGGTKDGSFKVQAQEWFSAQNRQDLRVINPVVKKGVWETYEVYADFQVGEGPATFRAWKNGELVYENKKWTTLRSADSESDMALIYTYWNGNAPQTQTMYMSDFTVTSDMPPARDADGNPYLGMHSTSNSPAPPADLSVQ